MSQVPLSRRVIFSDWHGVLSRDPFWTSIRLSVTHPLHAQLEAGMAGVFDPARGTANEWMKGLLSSDQVIADMDVQLSGRFRDDFLARRLDVDCAKMKVNAELQPSRDAEKRRSAGIFRAMAHQTLDRLRRRGADR